MDFRFTLFNACTLLVMLLTIAACIRRFGAGAGSNAIFVYYAVLLGYAFGFHYSLNLYVVLAGLVVALATRIGKWPVLRWAEIPVYGYVLWRGLSLMEGW